MHLPGWAIVLIGGSSIVYSIVTVAFLFCAIRDFIIKSSPKDDDTPGPKDFTSFFAIFLAIVLWPVVLALGIVIGIPAAIAKRFLCTPGYTCCGISFVKGPQPAAAGSPTARSNEHNMEAGLAAPAVVTVPPPAAPVEAMEMTPIAKRSSVLQDAPPPPPYMSGRDEV